MVIDFIKTPLAICSIETLNNPWYFKTMCHLQKHGLNLMAPPPPMALVMKLCTHNNQVQVSFHSQHLI